MRKLPRIVLYLLIPILSGMFQSACSGRSSDTARDDRPNILLIMADDMGFSDIGSYGGEVKTPALDKLAETGVRFTQFYNTARCSPTRASLMTGLYPHQAGLGDMPDTYAKRIREKANSPAYQDHLAYDTPTIAELLRGAGYATYMTGKWHLGYDRPQWPVDRGFDHSFTTIEGAFNYYGYGVQMGKEVRDPLMALDDQVYSPPREGFFTTDAFTDYAVKTLSEYDETTPFFMYVAYNAPHWPLQAPREDIEKNLGKYRIGWDRIREQRLERLRELGLIDPEWKLAPRPARIPAWEDLSEEKKDEWDLEMSIYAAQIERMDAGIARILAELEERGFADNTLVVFLSDNGGAAEDPNGSLPGAVLGERDSFEGYDLRGAHVSSSPFRRTKRFIHEGGISTPFIARWPNGFDGGGSIRGDVAHVIDLVPTFLDVANVDPAASTDNQAAIALEGTSLVPVFQDKGLPERTIFWEHEGNRGVRNSTWKLVSVYPQDWELYNMIADRTELNDLSATQPDIRIEMIALFDEWAARVGVQPWKNLVGK
jgi:arylsulfatase A-like enzyme